MLTKWCSSHNHDVTIDACVRCRLMCSYNPSAYSAGLRSMELVRRWGVAEIERFLDSRRRN